MPGFELSPTAVKVDAIQGSTALVDIISDLAWTASSDQSWLNVSPGSGNGNSKLTFTATANPTNTIRTAKVTVSATGVESQTISVVQSYVLQPTITKLYDFDCQYPYNFLYNSRLVSDGTYLYGIMQDISFDPKSKLIRIKPDGSNFEVLYSFDFSGYADVYLTLSENILYGTVNDYQEQDIIFKINTDGTNYSKFNLTDEQNIKLRSKALIISNNVIYGSLIEYDTYSNNLFKVNTDGSGYSVIYSSTENSFDNIILSGNTIIGVNYDKVIKVNTNGSGFFDFGVYSDIPVTVDKNIIYGMRRAYEGTEGYIFKVNTDGTGFTKIKTIIYPDFGSSPVGALTIVGNTLYGMTEDNSGVFKIKTDGSGFTKIQYDLQPGNYSSSGELTLVGNELFGYTSDEIISNTIFKINTNNDTYSKVFQFGISASGMFPMGALIESGNYLYGNTFGGGIFNLGTIFRINKDGSGYTKLFDFTGKETSDRPQGQLTLIGNTLYGITQGSYEQNDYGSIFKINTDGTGFTKLHEFDEINGSSPVGSLVLHDEILYGITSDGGIESHGVVYKINPDGSGFTKISDNTDLETGENPYNGICISDDDVIYGVTAVDYGGIFRVKTDGTGLAKIFEMNDESGDFSYCKPLLLNDELYITTSEGGANGVGTIFRIKSDGTGFTVLYNFEGFDEDQTGSGFRNNSLLFYNGALYGTASSNGINDHGYLYKINLDGTGFTKLSDFNGEYGSVPYLCDLIIDNNKDIYSMTTLGGKYSGGIIYKYSLNETSIAEYDYMKEKVFVQVYPNPVTAGFRVSGITGKSSVKIFDINGKLILIKEIERNEYVSVSSLPSGVYIVKINSEANNISIKLVKN